LPSLVHNPTGTARIGGILAWLRNRTVGEAGVRHDVRLPSLERTISAMDRLMIRVVSGLMSVVPVRPTRPPTGSVMTVRTLLNMPARLGSELTKADPV
jgi:hypothetical protein